MTTAAGDRDNEQASPWQATPLLRMLALGILLLGCFVILRPFLSALLWAVILCLSCFPLYSRLLKALRGRRTLASLIMTLGVFAILLAPFLIIGGSLADDVQRLMKASHELLQSPPPDPPAWIEKLPLVGPRAKAVWQHLSTDTSQLMGHLRRYVGPLTGWLLKASGYFLQGLAELALSILLAFFLFRDGAEASGKLVVAGQRLAGAGAIQLINVASNTIRGVVYGILGTALAQSVLAGIGFAIARVPGTGFLALLTFFLAVTPLGAALVWIPVAAWLFYKVGTGWGIFMIVWGVLVSSVDNVVKPMIIRHGNPMPFILILLGILGGAAAFGVIGIFLGPTLLALGLRVFQEWTAGQANALAAPSNSDTGGGLQRAAVVPHSPPAKIENLGNS